MLHRRLSPLDVKERKKQFCSRKKGIEDKSYQTSFEEKYTLSKIFFVLSVQDESKFFRQFRRNNEVQGGNIVLADFNDFYIAVAFLFIFSNSSQTFFNSPVFLLF
jgi:hypothetical protein